MAKEIRKNVIASEDQTMATEQSIKRTTKIKKMGKKY